MVGALLFEQYSAAAAEQLCRFQSRRAERVHPMKNIQSRPEEYDLLILGSGAGAKLLAWTFAGQGQRVAVVERKYVGGSCPNIACLPSKNVIHTARIASYFRRGEEFGL